MVSMHESRRSFGEADCSAQLDEGQEVVETGHSS
jgi:hypothetical protein